MTLLNNTLQKDRTFRFRGMSRSLDCHVNRSAVDSVYLEAGVAGIWERFT
jgi:hypothetical protein